MKKVLKRIGIVLVVVAVIVGGIFGIYQYNQSKKTAQVVSMSNYAMDGYWGDSIESYGTVASDKAQTVYLTKDQKIQEVKVQEGDYVNQGDVLLVIDKSSVDLKGEELNIQQAELNLKIAQLKLARLLSVTPVSDANQVLSIEDGNVYGYTGYSEYKTTGQLGPYAAGSLVARVFYDQDGAGFSTTYFDNSGQQISELPGGISLDDPKIENQYHSDEGSFIIGTKYYDGEDNHYLGCDIYDGEGDEIQKYTFPDGMTQKQLKESIAEQNSTVASQDLELRREKLKYQQMQESTDNGEILAKVSGTVKNVQDPDAINYNKAFMTITGTDNYYISGSIGEFYLDSVSVGDTVTVSSWETGVSVDAVIESISDSPTEDSNFYSDGNTNVSAYEFKASFDKDSGIELGTAVDISITPNSEDSSLYMYSAFIRSDMTGSYVMKMNPKTECLEKVYITTGKKLWGSYSEIKSGDISIDDYVAFPYGNGAIEGLHCEIVDNIE